MRLTELLQLAFTSQQSRLALMRVLPFPYRSHDAWSMLELTRAINGFTLGEWIRYQENK